MAVYEVLKDFTDLKDGRLVYRAGDTYPRTGYTPSDERIVELCGKDNKLKEPLIKPQKEVQGDTAGKFAEEGEGKPVKKTTKK